MRRVLACAALSASVVSVANASILQWQIEGAVDSTFGITGPLADLMGGDTFSLDLQIDLTSEEVIPDSSRDDDSGNVVTRGYSRLGASTITWILAASGAPIEVTGETFDDNMSAVLQVEIVNNIDFGSGSKDELLFRYDIGIQNTPGGERGDAGLTMYTFRGFASFPDDTWDGTETPTDIDLSRADFSGFSLLQDGVFVGSGGDLTRWDSSIIPAPGAAIALLGIAAIRRRR